MWPYALVAGLILLASCGDDKSGGSKPDADKPSADKSSADQAEGGKSDEDEALEPSVPDATPTFPELFTGSPCGQYGTVGCTQKGKPCNPNWETYTTSTADSITVTDGADDCRTINTHDKCLFSVGDGGVTKISFEFDVTDACHMSDDKIEWLAFWMYSDPWQDTREVDFIESKFGPGNGLNTNFAGLGNQVVIFDSAATTHWNGKVVATFTGSGSSVEVSVSNSVNANVGTSTLSPSDDYFFVMDTATGSDNPDCKITVSNLVMEGSVSSTSITNNCAGAISP